MFELRAAVWNTTIVGEYGEITALYGRFKKG
jgi:hypothetical protein